ncbi:predicted permeases [Bellilinea caldifistulae]|uniref:Probable membrane transporter protein n=1 Tax=Bellilinea caldifistulae TaxID=360411 RepID=A0A0P6WT94_9CHLR|nr:sulfite exporter TauE/SafE family protein [Bellilinea caldifistulae]KPL72343.1 membrane protein [Bellilinea caldifistulae]GAP09536.1 predicted permeases [Bellilinea caldifistulae]
MELSISLTLPILIFLAAILYASVGHGGASGYLAVMALFGVAPAVMKPTALTLNILVSAIAFFKFYRAGCFSWRLFLPFALTSVPLAFVGGSFVLPTTLYKPIVGAVLIYAAIRLFFSAKSAQATELRPVIIPVAVLLGAVIGLLSGLTGVGGGIFLSPLLVFLRWGDVRQTGGVAAAFILVNSISGLLGHFSVVAELPSFIPVWAVAAVAGGWLGAEFGSRRLGNPALRQLLAAVLVIAGLKMILV